MLWRVGYYYGFGLSFFLSAASVIRADQVDDVVSAEMQKQRIHGLSIAIIVKGEIATAKGYGFTDQGHKVPVTISTLFQAGSVSKPVAALGASHLVEQGKLSLDEDVNARLKSWKVPENELTKDEEVTLRRVLSHSAGLTVHGFPGYAVGKPVPTLVQILDGEKPANTAAIRVDFVPGSRRRYSGGAYTVMQQMLIEVTDKPFPQFMQEVVLKPLGMEASTYQQPLPRDLIPAAATGYYANGKEVAGQWHIYPEMAAAAKRSPTSSHAFHCCQLMSLLLSAGIGEPSEFASVASSIAASAQASGELRKAEALPA